MFWCDFFVNSGRIVYADMYNMLRNMEPPVGFGKKCPYRLAYRVCRLTVLCTVTVSDIINFMYRNFISKITFVSRVTY